MSAEDEMMFKLGRPFEDDDVSIQGLQQFVAKVHALVFLSGESSVEQSGGGFTKALHSKD